MANPDALYMSHQQACMYAERGQKLTAIRMLHRKIWNGEVWLCLEDLDVYPCDTMLIIESTIQQKDSGDEKTQ